VDPEESAADYFVTIIKMDRDEVDLALSEQLVASFILQAMESEDPIMLAMAGGAALALQCFDQPHETVDMNEEGGTRGVTERGVEIAQDIRDAHNAAHRIQALVSGLSVSEVDVMVTQIKASGMAGASRSDILRKLEETLLERKVPK
jgi:hypothetical protein